MEKEMSAEVHIIFMLIVYQLRYDSITFCWHTQRELSIVAFAQKGLIVLTFYMAVHWTSRLLIEQGQKKETHCTVAWTIETRKLKQFYWYDSTSFAVMLHSGVLGNMHSFHHSDIVSHLADYYATVDPRDYLLVVK
jgi:hypothetical protein